jgi:hypothetical protein
MESAWQLFLRQLASPDLQFTHDDVCGWSADEFEALTAAGLISEMALATRVVCDVCEADHWERVRWSEDGKRAYIVCPEAGIVDLDLERLRQWKCCLQQFAGRISKALGRGEVRPVPASRLWFLGRHRTAGHNPHFFLAAIGPDELPTTIKAVRQAYGRVTAMLFVPFPSPTSTEDGKLRMVDVGKAASLQDGQIAVDLEFIEEQFGDSGALRVSAKQPPKPLKEHRRAILRTYMEGHQIHNMQALGTHLGIEASILHAMIRGDTSKYGDTRLETMLRRIGCSQAKWDGGPKPIRRS